MAIKNLKSFKKELDKFSKEIDKNIVNCKKAIAKDALYLFIQNSPVVTGNYMANHTFTETPQTSRDVFMQPSKFKPPKFINPDAFNRKISNWFNENRTFSVEKLRQRETLRINSITRPETMLFVDNNVEYADNVEFGWYEKGFSREGYAIYRLTYEALSIKNYDNMDNYRDTKDALSSLKTLGSAL